MTQLLNKNKLVAIILCFTMLFSITSGIFTEAFAADETAANTHMVYDVTNGKDITLGHAQKATLTAQGGEQWQIYIYDADMWVDIAGKTGSSMELSYPLVASALTDRGTGELRCRLDDGSYSGIVNLVIDFSTESSYVKETEEEEVVVLTDTEELLEETDEELLEEEVLDENQDEVLDENVDDPAEENTDENLDEDTTEEPPADSTTDNNTTQESVVQQPADTTTGEDNVTTPEPSNTQNGSSESTAPETPKLETIIEEEPSLLDKLADGIKDKVSGAIDALKNFFKPDADEEEQDTKTPVVSEPEVKPAVTDAQSQEVKKEAAPVVSAPAKTVSKPVVVKSPQVTEPEATDVKSADNSAANTVTEQTTLALTKPAEEPAGEVEQSSSDDILYEGSTEESNSSGSSMQYALMTTEEDDGVNKTYTFTIEYLLQDEDGTQQIQEPTTGTLEAGAYFEKVFPLPTVPGYAPKVIDAFNGISGEKIEGDTYTFSCSNIQENRVIKIVYEPANVTYTVIHYKQNVDNDNYVEADRITVTGKTKELVAEDLALTSTSEYAGFYALAFERPRIAADGSTVVEIYYDRHYYLMAFNLDGGYGVEPIYAKFGTSVSVGTPTRLGYTFNGWSPAIDATVPAGGGTYTAQWTPGNNTKYTIVYWGENANDTNYSYLGYAEKTAVSGTPVSGADDYTGDKTGFHFDHADQNVIVKGDGSTIVNVYYKRNTYTLTFAYEGGSLICGTHVHSNSCYQLKCTQEEHKHTYEDSYRNGGFLGIGATTYYVGGCYPAGNADRETGGGTQPNCGKTEHEHKKTNSSSSCYSNTLICGQTGVTNHTHSVANGCYGMKFENVKYGQATDTYWTQAPTKKWLVNYSGSTFYTNAPAMPNDDLTIYGTDQSGSSVIHYYEKVNGQETTNKVRPDYTVNTDDWSFTSEDYIEIPGFTYSSSRKNNAGTQYYIYYTRNSYTLTFKNGSEETDGGTHLYEADISGTYFVPTYNGDEPEAYTFGGWYTTEQCVAGTQFNFTGAKMPYNNLILYAKWIPKTHTVTLYLDKEQSDNNGTPLTAYQVPHGTIITGAIETPEKEGYTFVAWFYTDENGAEKAFKFDSMPVMKDMKVYAKWTSDEQREYTVYYKIKDTDIEIADPTIGTALAGITKTFKAKGGSDLYADYQKDYYPIVQSHSITLDLENTANNTFTFWYVKRDPIPYMVRYVDVDGNPIKGLSEKIVVDNHQAVVTETFKQKDGMIPDAYQKTLVVTGEQGNPDDYISVNGVDIHKDNVLTFVYTENTTEAYYKITHYIETDNGWLEYQVTQHKGIIGQTYTADILKITGYTEDKDISTISGELDKQGLALEVYYVRETYPYQVRYLDYTTGKVLHEPVDGSAKYGRDVDVEAKEIKNYTLIGPAKDTLTIRVETKDDNGNMHATVNIYNFYYMEDEVNICYQAVGPEGEDFGSISSQQETVKIVNGIADGSTAKANENFRFVGWYLDEDCTEAVPDTWIKGTADGGTHITPGKTVEYTLKDNVDGQIVDIKCDGYAAGKTYYAKFDYNLMDLKIVKQGTQPIDVNQTFIFNVKGKEGTNTEGFNLQVVVQGDGTVTIPNVPYGEYFVTEDTNWSWRYNCTISVETTDNGRILRTFTAANSRSEQKWLDISTWVKNWFGASSATRP